MGETIDKIKNQLNEFWQGMDKNKKIKLGAAVGSFLIILTIAIVMLTKVNYVVLYSNLSTKDTALITKKLTELGIEWKVGEGQDAIMVPAEKKSKAILDLAYEGLPKSNYNIMDAFGDSSWTMTEYDKKQRMNFATENRMASVISDLDGIREAEVFLDIPEDTSFLADRGEGTASVMVKLEGGLPLSNKSATAIRNLVAGAIENLRPENVSITDDYGRNYDIESNDGVDFGVNEQFGMQSSLQSKYDRSVKRFLENIYGTGNVDVITNVKMNFDAETTKMVTFAPPVEGQNEGLIRSLKKVEKSTVNDSTGGVPGVESNAEETVDYATVDGSTSRYNEASNTINYELNQINREISKMPGQVEAITVAVVINSDVLLDGAMTPENKKEIEELIKAATGLETQKVMITASKFSKPEVKTEIKTTIMSYLPMIIIGIIAFIIVAALIAFIVVMRRRQREEIEKLLEEQEVEMERVEEIEFDKEKSEYKAQINTFVEKKPEAVAQLLRSWLNEE